MSVSPPLMCPQTSLEPALREHLDGKENVSMLWGWEVANLEQDANGATLTIVSGEGEDRQEMQIRATFVVACDGGRSPLRRLLDVHTYGEFVFARAVGMTIRSNQLFERLKQITGPGHFLVINKKFLAAFVNLKVAGDFSIHIILPRGTTDEKVNDIVSNPSRYIDMILGERVAHTVSVVSAYSMHGLVTTEFGVGRCFFAGDSAHQWAPAPGLGLNTGIGDVFNLTWKIAAVLKGYGGPQLLKSYEVERKPVCDLTRRYAMSMARTAGGGNTSVLTGISQVQ